MIHFNTIIKKYHSPKLKSIRFVHYENLHIKCLTNDDKLRFQSYKANQLYEKAEKHSVDNLSEEREYKQESICRAKRVIKDIVRSHYNDNLKLLTLTYKVIVDSRDKVLNDIKNMCKRYKSYYLKDLKYIATLEWQKKRHCIHVHMIIDSRYIPVEVWASRLWQQGFVKVNTISKGKSKSACYNAISYVLKYIQKDSESCEYYSHLYFRSRNWLNKPSVDYCTVTDSTAFVRYCNLYFGNDNYIVQNYFFESYDGYIVNIYDYYEKSIE